jgi:gamma-glutamylcyclotransferase (GGCT)/AIG2-like uncharacterized protein YtfP
MALLLPTFVFGYGSLVADAPRRARLRGHRRVWGVAMDNRVAIPGYKVYERADGVRPQVAVAFLDLAPAAEHDVNGGLVEVDHAALTALDRRERQYRRHDVTDLIHPRPHGRVWTYVGRAAGRTRVAQHRGAGRVVIQHAYAELVERAFARRGAAELERYRATTESPPFPLEELSRVDLPPA